jgi:hypothetical protein
MATGLDEGGNRSGGQGNSRGIESNERGNGKGRVPEINTTAPQSTYGANNKIVSTDRYAELQKRMKDKLNNLNAGFDPEAQMIIKFYENHPQFKILTNEQRERIKGTAYLSGMDEEGKRGGRSSLGTGSESSERGNGKGRVS